MLYEKHVEELMHYSSSDIELKCQPNFKLISLPVKVSIYMTFAIMYCLPYSLSFSSPPFTATNQAALAVKIKGGHFRRLPVQYSSDLNELVSSMLKVKVKLVIVWTSPSYFVTIGCRPRLRFYTMTSSSQ